MDSRELERGRLVVEVRHVTPAHVDLVAFDQGGNAGSWTIDRASYVAALGMPIEGERYALALGHLDPLPSS